MAELKPVQEDKVTRFSADLVEAAAVEGARQSRSAKQQLDHWVRVGRAVTSIASAQQARVEAALAGRLPVSQLTGEESVGVNSQITAAIEENLRSVHYGHELAAAGITTVALDETGRLVEHHPDGSTNVVDAFAAHHD
jgi:hypothetical protein